MENIDLDKIHIFKISILTKFTFLKAHFSQNSHLWNPFYHKIHIFEASNSRKVLDQKWDSVCICSLYLWYSIWSLWIIEHLTRIFGVISSLGVDNFAQLQSFLAVDEGLDQGVNFNTSTSKSALFLGVDLLCCALKATRNCFVLISSYRAA